MRAGRYRKLDSRWGMNILRVCVEGVGRGGEGGYVPEPSKTRAQGGAGS